MQQISRQIEFQNLPLVHTDLYCSLIVMNTTLKVYPSTSLIVFSIFLWEFPVLIPKSRIELIFRMGWARLPSPPTLHKPFLCFKGRPD